MERRLLLTRWPGGGYVLGRYARTPCVVEYNEAGTRVTVTAHHELYSRPRAFIGPVVGSTTRANGAVEIEFHPVQILF